MSCLVAVQAVTARLLFGPRGIAHRKCVRIGAFMAELGMYLASLVFWLDLLRLHGKAMNKLQLVSG